MLVLHAAHAKQSARLVQSLWEQIIMRSIRMHAWIVAHARAYAPLAHLLRNNLRTRRTAQFRLSGFYMPENSVIRSKIAQLLQLCYNFCV